MFSNLITLLKQRGLSVKWYADFLNVSEKTAYNKLQGITDFTFSEIKRTRVLFPEYNVDYLFAESEPKAS